MDKVVYVLGAGFSRPLGLPIMSDFMDKGKDMYSVDPSKYQHFQKVFRSIKELAYIKMAYSSDLENIEEILSILEMRDLLDNNNQEKLDFINFIVDVINYYTPVQKRPAPSMVNIGSFDQLQFLFPAIYEKVYGGFVLGLFNHQIKVKSQEIISENDLWGLTCDEIKNPSASYSIITLNYDLVLENIAHHILTCTNNKGDIHFQRSQNLLLATPPIIAKLHGSVDDRNIIPPTWNKTIATNPHIQSEWSIAYNLLKSANHIRFIGYSLPITDAYVRYLFKAGMLMNDHLKSIDVICQEKVNSANNRYDEFITLQSAKYHFFNVNTTDYLNYIYDSILKKNGDLEEGHNNFLSAHGI
jgi:hypothetical protein